MYVDESTIKNPSGKSYTRHLLRTSYRKDGKVLKKTIANISSCSKEEINLLKQVFGKKNKRKKDPNTSITINLQSIKERTGKRFGAVYVLNEIAKRIGFHKALGSTRNAILILWLIFARIIQQGSRLSAVRLAQSVAVDEVLGSNQFNEDDLYKAMDWLEDNHCKIEDALIKNNKPSQLLLYDVTSSYLEGQQNDLAAYGYNRDGKKGKKQIVVGLLTDSDGEPLCIETFKGNTQDPQTCSERIIEIKKRFNVDKLTLVGDRGMIKSKQIKEIESNEGWNYITAITKPQINKMLKQGDFQMQLFDEQVQEIIVDDVRYVLRRNPVRVKEIRDNRESKLNKLKAAMLERQQYLNEHPKAKEEVAIRVLNAKVSKLKISKLVKFESSNRTLIIVYDKQSKLWQEEEKLDGCYVIKTSIIDSQILTGQQVHDRYKDLAYVEQAFRTMKTTLLEQRPVYVRKEKRTKAHVFITMLAYKLSRYMIKIIKEHEDELLKLLFATNKAPKNQVLELDDVINELNMIQNNELIIDTFTCQATKELRPVTQKLLDILNIKLPIPQVTNVIKM